jgi:hypothetical protein
MSRPRRGEGARAGAAALVLALLFGVGPGGGGAPRPAAAAPGPEPAPPSPPGPSAAGPAAAGAPVPGDPDLAAVSFPGERPETWLVAPSRIQAEQAGRLIPVGKGAIFVPAMSDPAREPPYVVEKDGEVVETAAMGSHAVLDPGIYRVLLGSGTLGDRFSRRVLVKERRTTIVPATWGGVVVNVVDERSVPFRGSYELVALPSRTNYGLGLGADIELGEEVRTWLLPPGTYMLIKTGESYQARTDFYTFRLLPGELLRLTLVQDRAEGSFLGAGQMSVSEQETEVKDWLLHLVLGGDAEFNRRSDLVGYSSGYGFTLGGYLDFVAQYKPLEHLVYTRFKLEEKQVKFPDQPWQKDLDELRVDGLYVYRILPWLGPYVRAGLQTQIFPSYLNFDRDTTLVDAEDGEILGTGKRRFEVGPSFAPIEVKGGAGLSFLITTSHVLDAQIRVGFGARALFNRGLYLQRDVADTPEVELLRKGDAYQYGAEATIVGSLRLTRWVIATTEFEFLEPFNDPGRPVFDWETTIGLRLVSFASLNYIFKLLADRERSDHLQTEHRVLLRFTWRIL